MTAPTVEGSEYREAVTVHKNMLACGSAMAFTVALLNPMDVIKVAMQTSTTRLSLWGTAVDILRRDGMKGLFLPGLKSSMASDFVNGAFRLGLYPEVKASIASLWGISPTSTSLCIFSSFLTGVVGSFFGNPFDLMKIRLQYEAGLLGPDGRYLTGRCIGSKPTYTSILGGVYSLLGEGTFLRGAHATCLRAGLVTSAQVFGFEHTKRTCSEIGMGDGALKQALPGIISGLLATTVAAPVDVGVQLICVLAPCFS
ncbi:oxoglutarate/malate translocator protein, putative [Perkinsus marinus ATCC 50983]|uniref:Oxoglutarate/malate translocator protein, putative n=1 Tax=Perkinsus marinus (strain ATCC 50983 / TXsc) TaxID=423536 RepID=C5M039_PERM5|nr:oxoglutarate/malate translocator protein, putative [Perkinsus marinus ATCC 50983]EEQ97617.1 oxoglutarate/malate translocator protein, putative [Perkinsus marinus ATCC 50983]|eukprot:XP_002764900.1 oxoglutarate/malate translocator protein, putative [Perkinsus marinus ATCC 50983]